LSTDLGIAGVTRTLRNLLGTVASADYSGLPDDTRPSAEIEITTLPLDRVRNDDSSRNRLNLFLYQAEPSAAYRNMDPPDQIRSGETGRPMLALNLYYILTAYGEGDSELVAHVLLGAAMRLFHDHPVLSREELRDALQDSELGAQFERIRITPQPTSLDEISKLWTGFQSEYRLSSAYHVSVVLIESRRPSRVPLPVLKRGAGDRGPVAVATVGPTLSEIKEIFDPLLPVRAPHGKPSAELGDVIVLHGSNLAGESVTARFWNMHLDEPLELALLPERSSSEARVALPKADDPGVTAQWQPGFYTIDLLVKRPHLPAWATNRLAFALSPTLESINPASQAAGSQPFDLTATCRPQVLRDQQRVTLLLGDREFSPIRLSHGTAPESATKVVFSIDGMLEGTHVVRLRIDGADSVPIDFTATPPVFAENQKLTITP
jgi:hypothetical protein